MNRFEIFTNSTLAQISGGGKADYNFGYGIGRGIGKFFGGLGRWAKKHI